MSRRSLAVLLAVVVAGCGARGAPLPPLHPVPPPIGDLRIAQIGTDIELRFTPPPATIDVGDGPRPIDRVEILVLTERYPAITPELLATSLERERRERLEAARTAVEALEREAEQHAAQQAGVQGGEQAVTPPPAAQPEAEEGEGETVLTEEERLLRRVPRDAIRAWREAGLSPETQLDAARRLDEAVDRLWDALGLPTAIVDLRRPPALPDPTEIIAAARRVARTIAYERTLDPRRFAEEATVAATLTPEQMESMRAGDQVRFVQTAGIPANEVLRTRYHFGVRAVMGKREGDVARVVSLAPAPVPLPPNELTVEVVQEGVSLAWSPPAGDLWGRRLEPDTLRYNVYRRSPEQEWFPAAPRNPEPLQGAAFVDQDVAWGQRYVYAVRALLAAATAGASPATPLGTQQIAAPAAATPAPTAATPRKESAAVVSTAVDVRDVFPPPPVTGLVATRVGDRVTLRWQAVEAEDLDGYRVYRRRVEAAQAAAAAARQQDAADATGEHARQQDQQQAQQQERRQDRDRQQQPDRPRRSRQERRAQRRNPLLAAGWEMLTATPSTETRFVDPLSDPAATWAYLVEAVDNAGNASEPTIVTVEPER